MINFGICFFCVGSFSIAEITINGQGSAWFALEIPKKKYLWIKVLFVNIEICFLDQPYFNYSLNCATNITGFLLRNTHNDVYNDAGTRVYQIVDPATNFTITQSTLQNPQSLVLM